MTTVEQDNRKLAQAGRIGMRREGDLWVAYFALPDTMEKALFLGSFNMGFVQSGQRRQQVMKLMQEFVGDFIEEVIGQRPTWPEPPQPAPEHERSGRA